MVPQYVYEPLVLHRGDPEESVKFEFFVPTPSNLTALANTLKKFEKGYFPFMRVEPPRPMNPDSFVKLVRPWTSGDIAQYERTINPGAADAVNEIMSMVCRTDVGVSGTIFIARLDTSVENGYPFTFCNIIFLSMPREGESLELKKKTLRHEAIHVLQRCFPALFDSFYRRIGYIEVDQKHRDEIIRLGRKMGYTMISNPDTWRARLYGVDLGERGHFFVTNLAIEPMTGFYREVVFIVEPSDNPRKGNWRIESDNVGWLHEKMSQLRSTPGLPDKSREILSLIGRHMHEGHPHETLARYLETTGICRYPDKCPKPL